MPTSTGKADKRAAAAAKVEERFDAARERLEQRHAKVHERLERRRRELLESLDIAEYASGAGGEAWALMFRLFFREGKPRLPAIAAEFDLHPSQAIVLRMLSEPRSMGELADAMHCDNSNITGIVDRLEERGLAQRLVAEHDRRVKLIAATPDGARLREQLNSKLADPPEAITSLPAKDQRALRDILERALADS
ncbi:MAG: MarR family winged helix-turn-helix transcriptional regulator [Solirubrobacterales bacterium]